MSLVYRVKSMVKSISYLEMSPPFVVNLMKVFVLKKLNYSRTIKYPLHINLDITYACNARCDFCFNRELPHNFAQFSMDSLKKMLSELPKKGCHLFLSGGEPFIHKEIFEMIYLIKKAGHSCGLVTNSTLLNEEKVKKLIALKLDYIFFSLHGDQERHDKVTKITGSFDKVLSALELFKKFDPKNRCKLHVNSVITSENLHHYPQLIEKMSHYSLNTFRLAHPTFNFENEIKAFQPINHKYFSDKIDVNTLVIKELSLNPEEIIGLVNRLKKMKTGKMDIFFKPELSPNEIKSWYSKNNKIKRECFFSYTSLFIDPLGDIYPCPFLKCKMGNINDNSLANIWNNLEYRKTRRLINDKFPLVCRRCCKI